MTEAFLEMGAAFPALLRPLLEERDEYMVFILRRLALSRVRRVVAVVGAGHVPGMVAKWEQVIDIEAIAAPPPAVGAGRVWGNRRW